MIQSLNGKWLFRQVGKEDWLDATVPGCNFLDLMDNNLIDDPFKGLVEHSVQWVAEEDWEYVNLFTVDEDFYRYEKIILNCDMLDTICDIFVNDILVGKSKNCFLKFSTDINRCLKNGLNELRIVFHSPVKYVRDKYEKCPTPVNSNGMNGICHIRKPQCHFGWDWGPVLPSSGITGDVYLEYLKDDMKIENVKIEQAHNKGGDVDIIVNVAMTKKIKNLYYVEVKIKTPDKQELILEGNGNNMTFHIENPVLWWTQELSNKSRQQLYKVTVSLRKTGGKLVERVVKKIGLRKIELNRNRDAYGQNFQFILNGKPIFIKGANYIPPDCFITRFDSNKLQRLMDAVAFSRINMIRIWGGGYWGSDELYTLCDEMGILVWQDLPFACMAYPFFLNDFLENVTKEIEYNAKRLSHHPSLAVWCGNNEIEDMHMAWAHMKKYVDYTEKFFYHIPEPILKEQNSMIPYIPGSPCGIEYDKGIHSDNVGDTHLWGVWHGLQPMNHYRSRKTRFCSEFGFESLPDLKTIREYAKPGDFSLSSEVFKSHQKCIGGNDKMVYYIASRFNLPKHFRDYVYLSQITQQECIADATEFWRRNKGICNGSMYWQLNDCWGVCSWSSIDYNLNYKALQYKARYFNAALTFSVDDSADKTTVYLINDCFDSKKGQVSYEFFDFDKGRLEADYMTFELAPNSVTRLISFDNNELFKKYNKKKLGLSLRLYKNSKVLMQRLILFDKEKNLDLPKAKIKCKINIEKNMLSIDLFSEKFARYVKLESTKSTMPFSDNFIDLVPNNPVTVTIKKDPDLTLRELAESIYVYSLSDIEISTNKLKNAFDKYKLFASPANIANAVYHSKPSKDVKIDKE